jgi:enamine deaminase RidA (YjgF/YER057c/UK114 family)
MMNNTVVNAPGLVPPIGYADAMIVREGQRIVVLGGHVAFDEERQIVHVGNLTAQVEQTLLNLRATLEAAGGKPMDLVRLTIYTTDVPGYHAELRTIGESWRKVLGKVYPATTLVGVVALFERDAMVEIDGLAAVAQPRLDEPPA